MGFATAEFMGVIENGFRDDPVLGSTARSVTSLSFNDGTRTLTLSITAPATEYVIFAENQKYTITTTKTATIPDTEGIHIFYFDGTGTLITAMSTITEAIISNYCLVAVLYWDATNKTAIGVGDERHGRSMDSRTHSYLHLTRGAAYGEGLALGNLSVDGAGANADAQFSVGNGAIYDEDLRFDITDDAPQNLSSIAYIPLFYRTGASGLWRKIAATTFPVTTTGGGNPAYNQYTGATWQLTEVTDNNFLLMHYFATNDITNPIIGVVGQAVYNNIVNARAGANTELLSLRMGQLTGLLAEFVPIATVIFQANSSYANAVNARIRSTGDGDYVDWREGLVGAGAVSGVTDHGLLTGLTDDDHNGYPLNVAVNNFRLLLSGGNLTLTPVGGNQVYIDGTRYSYTSMPTLGTGGLSASTLYYIYLYDNAGTATLEASATVPTTGTNGYTQKTGDATRCLVGMAYTTAGTAWADSATQRFVASWRNRIPRQGQAVVASNRTTSSGTPTEMSSADRVEFVCWSDQLCIGFGSGYMAHSDTGGAYFFVTPYFDGTTAGGGALLQPSTSNYGSPAAIAVGAALSTGYHYFTVFGNVSAGTGTWPQNNVHQVWII